MVVHEFRQRLPRVTVGVRTVRVLTRLLPRPALSALSGIHVLVVVEVPVFVLVKMLLHFRDSPFALLSSQTITITSPSGSYFYRRGLVNMTSVSDELIGRPGSQGPDWPTLWPDTNSRCGGRELGEAAGDGVV